MKAEQTYKTILKHHILSSLHFTSLFKNIFNKSIFIVVFFAFFLIQNAHGQNDSKAKKILDKVAKKYETYDSFSFFLNQRMVNEMENIDESFSGNVTVKGNKFRLTLGDQEIYNNGSTVWTYLKDAHEVNIEDFEDSEDTMTPAKIFELYKKNYHYKVNGSKVIKNVKYHIIDLAAKDKENSSFYKVRMTINDKNYLLKEFVIFEKSGNKYIYQISNFKSNISLKDDYFVFNEKDYKNVEVVDLR